MNIHKNIRPLLAIILGIFFIVVGIYSPSLARDNPQLVIVAGIAIVASSISFFFMSDSEKQKHLRYSMRNFITKENIIGIIFITGGWILFHPETVDETNKFFSIIFVASGLYQINNNYFKRIK